MEGQRAKLIRASFSFPSETTVFFLLLILSAVFVSVNIAQNTERVIHVLLEDEGKTQKGPFLPPLRNDESNSDLTGDYARPLIVPGVSVMILFLFSFALFTAYPEWIKGRSTLSAETSKGIGEFRILIAEMAALHGIRISVLIRNSKLTANARAFGNGFRNYVMIDEGLRFLKHSSRKIFDAVMAHEFSHLLNKDVSKTYASIALWNSTVLIFFIPLMFSVLVLFYTGVFSKLNSEFSISTIGGILTNNLPQMLKVIVQGTLMYLLIVFFRNSILRSREFYADMRACLLGHEDGLLRILESKKDSHISFFRKILSYHPPAVSRARTISDPALLFRQDLPAAFFTGSLLAVIVNASFFPAINVILLTSMIIFPGTDGKIGMTEVLSFFVSVSLSIIILTLCFLGLAFLIAGTAGLSALKESYATKLTLNKALPDLKKLMTISLLFIAGFEAGFLLQPFYSLFPSTPGQIGIVILLDLILASTLMIVMLISRYSGAKLALVDPGDKRFRRSVFITLAINCLIAGVVLLGVISLRIYILAGLTI